MTGSDGTAPDEDALGLAAKVAFLSRPESFPERPAAVEVVQTHMSCVFLTERHAWKLKKPVRCEFLDFSTVEARRRDCEEEVRLNRRMAPGVYLDVVPLVALHEGKLRLGGSGVAVDWLVRMRRLPRRSMLDQALRDGAARSDDVRRIPRALAAFLARAEPVPIDPSAYRRRFETSLAADLRDLEEPGYGFPSELVHSAGAAVTGALAREAPALESRARDNRIVEGHGDLRPEHVCLAPEPLFIDCLEFQRDWRLLDPADELAYLAMECELAGAGWIGPILMEEWREAAGDDPPAALVEFYMAYRAVVRAKLAAWHLKDHPDPADQGRWSARAQRYLELALRHGAARGTGEDRRSASGATGAHTR